MLVHLEPAETCHLPPDLVLAQLPSKKQLWEAGDEFAWKAERDKEPRIQTAFALARNGELVQLHAGLHFSTSSIPSDKSPDVDYPPTSTANWEEWCSGMDGFSGLVMLTASLIVQGSLNAG
jgi:hypothetical protein